MDYNSKFEFEKELQENLNWDNIQDSFLPKKHGMPITQLQLN